MSLSNYSQSWAYCCYGCGEPFYGDTSLCYKCQGKGDASKAFEGLHEAYEKKLEEILKNAPPPIIYVVTDVTYDESIYANNLGAFVEFDQAKEFAIKKRKELKRKAVIWDEAASLDLDKDQIPHIYIETFNEN